LVSKKAKMKTTAKTVLLGLIALVFSGFLATATAGNNFDSPPAAPQDVEKYGDDSLTCLRNLSLYREFYKQWKASNYTSLAVNDAITPWRWVYANCPQSSQNAYIDGVNMMDYFMKNSKSEEAKLKYVDTMMMIYDQRIKYFGREGYVLGRKGADLMKFAPEEYEKAYHIFKKSIELRGNKSESFVLVYYFRSVISMVADKKLDKSAIIDAYDQLSGIIDFNIKESQNDPTSLSAWENVKGNIELSFEPYATCDDLIGIYQKKFDETPNDVETLKKITGMLDKKKCTDNELFFNATLKLNELEPSPNSSYLIAKMLINKEKFDQAIPYLENALKIEDDNTKADVYLLLASVYRHNKNYTKARAYAYNALDLRPDEGNAYLMIGDMYAASASDCGDNDLTKKVAYWAAVDKYRQAKNVDPDVADAANNRIDVYSRQFPLKETIFFYNLNEGDDYTVGCWINERTTIRAMK
jgi:tetratricopeptide (TPR) repeat protein